MSIGIELDAGDGKYSEKGAIDPGSTTTLTVVGAGFDQDEDVDKLILVEGANTGGSNLLTTIASVTSPDVVELTQGANAGQLPLSNAFVIWGDDWTAGTTVQKNIQEAIDSIAGNAQADADDSWGVGGIVYLPPGIYLTSKQINLKRTDGNQNVSIWGAGPLATLIFNVNTNGKHAFFARGTASTDADAIQGVCLRDISIRGNSDSGDGVKLDYAINQVRLDRVEVAGHGGHGVLIDRECKRISISNCRIRQNGSSGIWIGDQSEQIWLYANSIRNHSSGNGLYLTKSNAVVTIYGGDIHGNKTGIFVRGADNADEVGACEFRGIYFESNGRDVFVGSEGNTQYAFGIVIAGNSFSKTTGVDHGGTYCVSLARAKGCTVEQNEFRNITAVPSPDGIVACINLGTPARDNFIGHNTFERNVTRPILTNSADGAGNWGFVDPSAEYYFEMPSRDGDDSRLRFVESTGTSGFEIGRDGSGNEFFIKRGDPPTNTVLTIDGDNGKTTFQDAVSFDDSIVVGAFNPNPKAVLDLNSLNQGLLLPRLDPGDITNPTPGLLVYNTELNKLSVYNGSGWIHWP